MMNIIRTDSNFEVVESLVSFQPIDGIIQNNEMVHTSEHNLQDAGVKILNSTENMNSIDAVDDEPSPPTELDVDMANKELLDEVDMIMENSPDIDMVETMSIPEMLEVQQSLSAVQKSEPVCVAVPTKETTVILNEDRIYLAESATPLQYVVTEIENASQPSVYEDSTFEDETIIELSRHSWGTIGEHYIRGCSWSPDGTCILVPVNRDGVHIFELPTDLYACETVSEMRPFDVLQSAIHIREGGTIYDSCWYPFMNSTVPASCCWLLTQQHGPIQMFDAFDGALRCTYRGYDSVDEVEAALSVCFSTDGASVIGGYRKALKLFRTDLPGRDFTNFPLKVPASCLAVHPAHESLIAIGSWNATIALHDVRTPKLDETARFGGGVHRGGVTMIQFAPANGERLWSGARKDSRIVCWDVRNTTKPISIVHRTVSTNQRIQFDISRPQGRWLASGDTDGLVRVWDLLEQDGVTEYKVNNMKNL